MADYDNKLDDHDDGHATRVEQDYQDRSALTNPSADVFELAKEQFPQTLLQYENPVILPGKNEDEWEEALKRIVPPAIVRQKAQLSERPVVTTTDKVLVSIFPPRVATVELPAAEGSGGSGERVRLVQSISHEQIDRNHLRDLKDVFDYKLRDSKARMSSLCPVRRAIHSMLFDELLRQVAIDNPERGLLLLRIRDELQMTLDAYQSLYEAASDYGQMKLQEGTTGKPEMLSRIKDLTAENDALKKEVKRLQTKHLAILRCVEERQETDKKKFAEERAFWERTRQRLVAHLETVKQMQEAEKRALREGTA